MAVRYELIVGVDGEHATASCSRPACLPSVPSAVTVGQVLGHGCGTGMLDEHGPRLWRPARRTRTRPSGRAGRTRRTRGAHPAPRTASTGTRCRRTGRRCGAGPRRWWSNWHTAFTDDLVVRLRGSSGRCGSSANASCTDRESRRSPSPISLTSSRRSGRGTLLAPGIGAEA